MKPLAWLVALAVLAVIAVPLGLAVITAAVAAPALKEQLRIDPCSYLANGQAATTSGLPAVGSPRRASLHNPPLSIPARIRALYVSAAARYRVPWSLLAGVGMAETAHGRNNHTSVAGAQGLMQFMPGTFRAYGVDGNHDGRKDIDNDADSIYSAAHYLSATGATRTSGVRRALWTYNHSTSYANDVLAYAHHYAGTTGSGAAGDCNDSAGPLPDGPNGPCPPSGSSAERGLKPNALRALRCAKQAFSGIHYMGGVGPRSNVSDHPYGRAVDFMIPRWNTPSGRARGWQLAHWFQKHAAALHVKYIIFDMKVWRAYRASQGWQPYTFFGSHPGPTLGHKNHVHLSVY